MTGQGCLAPRLSTDIFYLLTDSITRRGKQTKHVKAQSCPTICDPMDCSLRGCSVHGISQARVLEWVALSFSRGSSQPRDWTQVSHITGRRFYHLSHQGSRLEERWTIFVITRQRSWFLNFTFMPIVSLPQVSKGNSILRCCINHLRAKVAT